MPNMSDKFPLLVVEGAWVRGYSNYYEADVFGYATKVDYQFGEVKIMVTECKTEPDAVGQETVTNLTTTHVVRPQIKEDNRDVLLAKIDAALAAGDKAWFNELTQKLSALRKQRVV